MLTKEAIDALAEARSIEAAAAALTLSIGGISTGKGHVALPKDFTVHDLERSMPLRRRARGAMTTSVLGDFAAYLAAHKEPGTTVFVDQRNMAAVGVLNLGTPAAPGHADDTATLGLKQMAAYTALLTIVQKPRSQTEIAEFLEDWHPHVNCVVNNPDFDADESVSPTLPLSLRQAIAAVRTLTIESMSRIESEEKDLNKSLSTFDQVKVNNKVQLPSRIDFKCVPWLGLDERTFALRLSVITTGDKPSLHLRIVNLEQHAEEMADELAAKVRAVVDTGVPVHIGAYAPK